MLSLQFRPQDMYHTVRDTTPPLVPAQMFFPNSAESHVTAHSFHYTSASNSPESILTDITAPSRGGSPGATTSLLRGPTLLPKIRCQDQAAEPTAGPVRHHRTVSASPAYHHFAPYPYGFQRPTIVRARTRSPEGRATASPASARFSSASSASALTAATTFSNCSTFPVPITRSSSLSGIDPSLAVQSYNNGPCDHGFNGGYNSGLNSPIAFHHPPPQAHAASRRSSLAHVRTSSLPPVPPPSTGHSRTASGSSVDEATVRRHGYPTQYRQIPQYVTHATQAPTAAVAAPPMLFTQPVGPSFLMNEPPLSLDEDLSFTFPQETTSLLSYLSAPNPAPGLIHRSVNGDFHRKNRDWWWWDVRNLRSWADFNIDSVLAVQDFERLLSFPQDVATLAQPARPSATPETEHNLRVMFNEFFATKVNAALKATLGEKHIFMQAQNSATNNPWPKPDFISNYSSDYMKTYHNDPRGRLVGLVKPYQVWNTGMRTGDQAKKVQYLHGLAHLHRVMREHRCRYGFIITEIELLCVRAGAKDDEYTAASASSDKNMQDEGPTPYFGYLEIANPIQLSTCTSSSPSETPQMTAPLALWYLHMLAKEEPLAHQPAWKMHVGGPAERTRRFCLEERDAWMPKAQDAEKRNAKNIRGWVWPEDAFHKKENLRKERRR